MTQTINSGCTKPFCFLFRVFDVRLRWALPLSQPDTVPVCAFGDVTEFKEQ